MTPNLARFPVTKKPAAPKQRVPEETQASFRPPKSGPSGNDEAVGRSEVHRRSLQGDNEKAPQKSWHVQLLADRSYLLYFAAVLALLAAAFLLRTWGSSFGLPSLFHPDEEPIVDRSLGILRTGDFNPHWFNYPSLYVYVQAAADVFVFLSSMGKQVEKVVLPLFPDYEYVRVGRTVTAVAGTITVLTVYYAGRTLFSARVGLIAAALLTFSLLHVVQSHYITTDVPMTLFVALSLLASALVLRSGNTTYYALAGLTAGFAASTKYNGGLAIATLLVAHFFVAWRQRSAFNSGIVFALAAFLVGFFLGTPFTLLDLPGFLKGFAFEVAHYRTGQGTFEGDDNLVWYLQTVLASWDGVVLVFALAGLFVGLLRWRAADYLLLVFPIVYIWSLSTFVVRFERNLVPLFPFIALLAAIFIDWPLSRLAARWARFRPFAVVLGLGLMGLAAVPSLIGVVEFDSLLAKEHPKAVAAEWANRNLPPGAKIAVEAYGIPLDPRAFELVNVQSVADRTVAWFVEQEFDYVVVSDGVWVRYYTEPEKYPKEVAAYEAIFSQFELVEAVEAPAPSQQLSAYPTIEVYHLPRVRIYKVKEMEQ